MTDETEDEVLTPDEGAGDESESHDDVDSEEGDGEADTDGVGAGDADTRGNDPIDVEAITRRADAAEAAQRETQALLVKMLSGNGKNAEEEQRKERERVSNMSPEEKALYVADQAERRINFVVAQSEFKIKDANDRADFAALCARNPVASKLAGEVEKRILAERAKGYNYDREIMLKFVAGEKALASAEKGGSKKQKREASERVSASSTKSTRAVGDKKLNGKSDPNSREARLERLRGATF